MAPKDDFYVGYGKAPASFARFSSVISILLLTIAALSAIAWAMTQDDTGDGQWRTSTTIELEGKVVFEPYPMLKTLNEDGSIETYLLGETDKKGADERAAPFEGQMVKVKGVEIVRGPRRILTLEATDSPIVVSDTPDQTIQSNEFESLGTFTLKGEILDSKCYLGVMKPGEGKTHKACATLCILGDIPPLFLIKHADDTESAYLVTGPTGKAIRDEILPFVADPVQVSGEVGWQDDMPVFRIDPLSITRLAGRSGPAQISRLDDIDFAICHHDDPAAG